MLVNHIKFVILTIFIFTTINKSFCQKNGLGVNLISWSNISVEYERYFLSHSRISVGYRLDYRIYEPFWSFLFDQSIDHVRKGHKALFEYRFYFSKDAHLNDGFYVGYSFINGKNQVRYFDSGSLNINSNSNVFKVGYQINTVKFNIDWGISFSKNTTKGGVDSFVLDNGDIIYLGSDVISLNIEMHIGYSYLF